MPKPKDEIKKEQPEKKETQIVEEIGPQVESDKYTFQEKKEILKVTRADIEYGESIQEEYIEQKRKDLMHYHCAKPSELENLIKKAWQSDRNLGLARAVADSFQATYVATVWTPDTINFVANTALEIDNRTNQEKFTKWGMGNQEANTGPEVDGFVHNQIVVGGSFYKIYRKIYPEWVDKRIPVKNKDGKTIKYEIKTEKVTIQKGVIENIPDIDDILMPKYGKNIQELPFFVHILHLDGEEVLDYIDRKIFRVDDVKAYKKKFYNHAYNYKKRTLGEQKLKDLGINEASINDSDIRRIPIDIYEWYGYYTKNGRRERYRFYIDLTNEEMLGGKPLRKINRSGKIPFAGGSIWHEPGQLRGPSYMQIIAPIVNAFNNVFNQKSDFQYVTNCPFGFHNPDEGYTQQTYELEPNVSYPVSGEPSKSVYFPNLQRSMAWAESDMRILFEVLERLTGAASYFAVGQQRNKTLGQDLLVDKQSETRFGLGAKRIMAYNCEAISMWFELYQDYPPKNLAERVVGVDGKKLFPNLSIDSLRGDTGIQMTPDVVSGSRAYRKQLQLWVFQAGQQTLWLNPQINPKGNYNLTADTFKEILGISDNEVKRYLGPEPKSQFDEAELDNEWYRFMQGEDFEPPEGVTMIALQHLEGHTKQKAEKYHLLDEEYRPNFDAHYFKTVINVMKLMKNAQQETIANTIASQAIMQREAMPQQMPATQPGIPQGQPGMPQTNMPTQVSPGPGGLPGA